MLAGHWNRLSDAEAATRGLLDVIALGLVVFALVRTTATSGERGG